MKVCINVGKYLRHKVPEGFPASNARIVLYFALIFWRNVNAVRQFCYWYASISRFQKTPVKLLQVLVLANTHVFTEFEGIEDSPKGAFICWCCCDVGSGTNRNDYVYSYISIASSDYMAHRNIIPTISGLFVSFGISLARVGLLGAENNFYLLHHHIVSFYYHHIFIPHCHIRVKQLQSKVLALPV